MKFLSVMAILAIGFSMSGCATIIDGTTQSISVASAPEQGANCTLKNSQGTYYVTTPGTVTVHKTKTDLDVHCTKVGYLDADAKAVSKFGGATAGNVIAGGVIGLGVDAASGANYYYDTPIMVELSPAPVAENTPAVPLEPGM